MAQRVYGRLRRNRSVNGKWFLFTARPPERAAFVAEACVSNEGACPVVMRDDNGAGLGAMMDEAFRSHPDLDFYGWLADDTYPQTKHWDEVLSFVAGANCLSYADDGGYLSPGGGPKDGSELSSGLCWGGNLLRSTGSWSLGFRDAWIDMAWLDLLRPLGRLRYVPSVTVRHDNWRTGRRAMDELDNIALRHVDDDRLKFFGWQQDQAPRLRQQIEGMAACVS